MNTKKAEKLFREGYACSQSILLAFSDDLGIDENVAKKVSSTFGGGMGRLRKTCGALTGAFMVLGLKYGNTEPGDLNKKLDSYKKVQQLTQKFKDKYGTTSCATILKKHASNNEIINREHHRKICDVVVHDAAVFLSEIINSQ
jgi:C_GCAxxG_C_C family probable redox protein